MPSVLSRLASLFPAYRRTYAPNVPTPEERAVRVLADTKAQIDASRARPRPSSEEKIPTNYNTGAAGKVWFLPYLDSTTQDSPEIRAAMRLMRRSPWVKAAWEPQILTVASEDWQVQAGEPGNPESEEQADSFKAMIEECISGAMVAIVRAICAPFGSEGHSLAEPVWDLCRKGKHEGKIVCTKFAARDTDSFNGDVRLGGDAFGNVKWVESRRAPGQAVYPIEDFVFSRYLTVFDEPLGEAAFRPAYGSWWMLDTIDKLRMIHTEKKMAGMLVGTYENDDDKGPLEAALRLAKTATWACIPQGTKMEALAISTASEPDYKSHQESKRDEIVTGIAFATLQIIQGNVPDARGDTKVQKSMADLGPWLLMQLVCDAVNRQFAPKYIDYNYPYPAGGVYPKLTFGAASNAELLELLQVVTGAQAAGFTGLSKKHYAKALSLQLADPNDPEDALETPGQGGMAGGFGAPPMGGGFPPDDGFGGQPAGLPPFDPMGGAPGELPEGFAEAFAEEWDSFAWAPAQTARHTVKAVWQGPGQRRPLYGAAARKALGPAEGAQQPAPAAQPPAAQQQPTVAPAQPAKRGKLRRAAGALGRGAKAVGRAKYNAGKKTVGGTVYALAKGGQFAAGAIDALGAALQRVPVLESVFGVGTVLRKEAKRKLQQARQTAALAASGDRKGAAKRAAFASAKLAAIAFEQNTRKYGKTRAVVMEAAFWGAKIALGGTLAAGALALTGTTPAGLATAGFGALAGYKAAKTVFSMVVSPLLRKAIEFPLRFGRGKRGANNPARALAAQMDRGRTTAAPGNVTAAARADRAKAGPGPLYVPGQAATRSRRFAEEPGAADPLDLIADLRAMLDQDAGRETDVTDGDLAALLADLLEYADELGEGVKEEAADAFAEASADWTAEQFAEWDASAWHSFAWQAARTRGGSVKAVGTGEDSGKPDRYGADARAALARQSGASKRQDAPRTVTYTTTDADGNVTQKREAGVSPERARAMAVAAALAQTEAAGGPTAVKVTKQRAARKKAVADETGRLEAVGQKAASGDPAAAKELADTGAKAVEAAAAQMAKLGPVPAAAKPMIRSTWATAARGLPKGQRKEAQTLLDATFGSFGRDVETVRGAVGALAGWVARQGAAGAKRAAGALGRFALGLAKLGWRGTKAVARGVGYVGLEVAKGARDRGLELAGAGLRGAGQIAGAAWRTAKPFAYWGAAVVGAAVLIGAPTLAAITGVIPLSLGFALAPLTVGGVYFGGRRVARKVASMALVNQGNGAIVPRSQGGTFAESVHAFAWSDWKQDGKNWKSPGGRVLSDASYQKLSRGKGGEQASAPKATATDAARPVKAGAKPPAVPQAGSVYQVDPKQIAVDPGRFQFKLNTDSVKGVGTELSGVANYDPELGGVLAVWRDPSDGKTYVVNGHHRLDLANRAGAPAVSVRYLTAPTAELARAKGALINIAEGRGTAVDAAKFLRDTGRSADDLAKAGVSLKGNVARDAADLVKLSPELFRQVAYGTLDPDRAVAVARHLDDHLDQQLLLSALAKQEDRTGRAVGPRVVEAMAQEMKDAPKLTTTQESLFGPIEQDESVYFHRAELKSYVRAELAKEARDFRLGSSVRRATALEAVGSNTLDVQQNRKVADKADAALEDFDRGARLKGALSDTLNDFAVEYANASTGGRSQLRGKVLAAVRALLSGGDVQRPGGVEQRSPGLFD